MSKPTLPANPSNALLSNTDHYVDTMANIAEISIDPSWKAAVVSHVENAGRMAAILNKVTLNENECELAAIYQLQK